MSASRSEKLCHGSVGLGNSVACATRKNYYLLIDDIKSGERILIWLQKQATVVMSCLNVTIIS